MTLKDSMYRIKAWHTDGATTAADITFCPEHIIYQAHFPGQPVTPGVCLLQIACELLQTHLCTTLALTMVKNMKFANPVSPIDTPEVTVSFRQTTDDGTTVTTRGDIMAGSTLYTKFSLIFRHSDRD